MQWWAHSRLHSKIFVAFSGLILVVLLSTLWFVQLMVSRQVQQTLWDGLVTTGQIFRGLLAERAVRLQTNGALLASDFALKRVLAMRYNPARYDPETLVSVAQNYQARMGADLLWITDETGALLADSQGRRPPGTEVAGFFPLDGQAEEVAASASLTAVDGQLVQLIAVPVFGPEIMGFLVFGEQIGALTVQQLEHDTGSQISFFTEDHVFASSWSRTERAAVFPAGRVPSHYLTRVSTAPFFVTLGQERFLSLVIPIPAQLEQPLHALVQQSYDHALAPLSALRWRIVLVGASALLVALLIGGGIARGITAPVQHLVAGMQAVLRGNLQLRLHLTRHDEIGFLARSFDGMIAGLEEREKIRDVIQKVVSPEVAHELLERGLALGGEVREVSVLFADIRQFTSLSENCTPPELVTLLNAYFSCVSQAIEQEQGIIDKYIGDAVMATFGAPLAFPDHAVQAVAAGLGMLDALERFNAEHEPTLRIGIGIASGPVVAGNVGSPERLNYTVLGDTVNVAARLQDLTKLYQVPLIMSGTTYEQVAAHFSCRFLGNATVRGRQREISLYTVER